MSNNFTEIDFVETSDEYFPSLESVQSSYIAFADMNLDGKKDILVHIFGGFPDSKFAITAEKIDDSLVVYLSNPDNDEYQIGNELIFGEKVLSLGGAMSRDYEVDDYNGDGYPDVAYAMNLEDGRPSLPGFTNWFSEIAVVMSNGNGTYRVDIIDIPDYHHSLTALHLPGQNPTIVFASKNSRSESIAIQYKENAWVEISGLPPLTGGRAVAFENRDESNTINYIFTGLTWNSERKTEQGIWKLNGGAWEFLDAFQITGNGEKGNFISWNGAIEEKEIFEINNSKIIDLAIWEAASIDLFSNGDEIVLALLSGSMISDSTENEFKQNDLRNFNYFVGYDVEKEILVQLDDLVIGQDPESQSYKFSILDVDNNGYQDLVSYPKDDFQNGNLVKNDRILIYLNDGNGKLVRTDKFIYPTLNHNGESDALLWPIADLVDLDQDGILDIFYFSSSPLSNDIDKTFNNDYIKVFRGLVDQFISEGVNRTYAASDNVIYGTSFGDVINTGKGNKYIATGDGEDIVTTNFSREKLFLGNDNDKVIGVSNLDEFDGGDGIDILELNFSRSLATMEKELLASAFTITFESGQAFLKNIERLHFEDTKLALDIDGNAGTTAKILGAFLGASGIERADLVGVGLGLLDGGMTYEGFLQAALDAVFGPNPSGATLVNHFYGTLTGQSAPQSLIDQYGSLIDNGSLTPVSLAMQVTENELNIQNIDLVGLSATGIEYT